MLLTNQKTKNYENLFHLKEKFFLNVNTKLR
jgi:hypothetical protein